MLKQLMRGAVERDEDRKKKREFKRSSREVHLSTRDRARSQHALHTHFTLASYSHSWSSKLLNSQNSSLPQKHHSASSARCRPQMTAALLPLATA